MISYQYCKSSGKDIVPSKNAEGNKQRKRYKIKEAIRLIKRLKSTFVRSDHSLKGG
jgi:hypothetical protein